MIFFSGLVRFFSAELASTFGFGLCSGTTLAGLWVGGLISWETGASTLGVGAIGCWFCCERSVKQDEKKMFELKYVLKNGYDTRTVIVPFQLNEYETVQNSIH
jgi:hypothetical protein